jgi:hypothetical protein
MRGLVIASLVSALLVSGCTNGPPTRAAEVKAISIGDKAYRCLKRNDIGASSGSIELTGDLRARMLTPQATIAGVRVFIESTSVTTYGSQTVYFVNSTNDCLLWAEGITMQEFSQRLGLNPVGLSPAYQSEPPKPTEPPATLPITPPTTPPADPVMPPATAEANK